MHIGSVLNQAVKRNAKRFPEDFMFQLTRQELSNLMSQFVISRWGGIRKMPYAFTEQGVAMLSGLLNSDIAIDANIRIMRAFVKMRRYALSQADALTKSTAVNEEQIAELRKLLLLYIEKNDKRVDAIVEVLNKLISAPCPQPKPKRAIGFRTD
jgi:hypothetical protein